VSLPLLVQALEGAPEPASGVSGLWEFVRGYVVDFAKENPYVVFLMVWGAIQAMGTTVRTGTTGLFFSFGRATRTCEPGLVLKIPYFQTVRVLPTRWRTLDVPDQRVTSADGLVWFVDVNLVYRIVDVRKALIEIDDLDKGMLQILGLAVQEIVRGSGRERMRLAGGLDEELEAAMARRLDAWGVQVDHAGFTSIRPSPKTLRLTQQRHASEVRGRALGELLRIGVPAGHALAMLGSAPRVERRERRGLRREVASRRRRRVLQGLRRGLAAADGPRLPVTAAAELRRRALRRFEETAS
jgi:hypothetical protein